MRKLFILGVSSLFLGSPAMSATYSVDGFSTGNEGEASSGDAPRSVSGGGNAAGFGGVFSATATNVGGGSVTASASEGISDVNRYTFSGDEDGVVGESEAGVQYAIEIVGPTTNALIPVDVTMLAHADALSLPFIDGFANSIVGFASAGAYWVTQTALRPLLRSLMSKRRRATTIRPPVRIHRSWTRRPRGSTAW
jgi:hypothetical protein